MGVTSLTRGTETAQWMQDGRRTDRSLHMIFGLIHELHPGMNTGPLLAAELVLLIVPKKKKNGDG